MSYLKIFNLHTMCRNGACCSSAYPHRQDKRRKTVQENEGGLYIGVAFSDAPQASAPFLFCRTTNNGKNIVCFVAHSNIIYYIYNIPCLYDNRIFDFFYKNY